MRPGRSSPEPSAAVQEGVELDEALLNEPTLVRGLPEKRLSEPTDPVDYLGSAGVLVDSALRRADGESAPA
jgi:3-carboxy-cis,cis-muconate cycloisomerase